MSNLYFNNQYTACEHAFDTTRKSAAIAASVLERPIESVIITDPTASTLATEDLLRRLHQREYVQAVRTGDNRALAESQGFTWDEGVYTMAVAHNSGLVAATDAVLLGDDRWAGSLSSGLHHASSTSGSGYCTFNGLAVAVLRTREQMVAEWTANAGVPTVVTIAGGYTWGDVTMEQLVGLHRSTFEEFAAAA